jgi:hypothetical protein
MGDFDWLTLTLLLAVVCLHQSSFLHQELSLEKLKGTWDGASLRTKTLKEIKENMGQCESKERDFKQ